MSELNFGEQNGATKLAEPEANNSPRNLGLSMDEFSALEERIVRAVSLVRRERQARTAAEERANELEAKLNAPNPELARLTTAIANTEAALSLKTEEVAALHTERDQLRQRVERILTQLDSLEL